MGGLCVAYVRLVWGLGEPCLGPYGGYVRPMWGLFDACVGPI